MKSTFLTTESQKTKLTQKEAKMRRKRKRSVRTQIEHLNPIMLKANRFYTPKLFSQNANQFLLARVSLT